MNGARKQCFDFMKGLGPSTDSPHTHTHTIALLPLSFTDFIPSPSTSYSWHVCLGIIWAHVDNGKRTLETKEPFWDLW